METLDDKYYSYVPQECDFPGMQFDEVPIPVIKQRVISNLSSKKSATRLALTFSSDLKISLAEIDEIRFIDELARFNDILFPAVGIDDIPDFIGKLNCLMAEMTNGKNPIISSVFLIISTRDDVEAFISKMNDLYKILHNVIQLVVVLRQGEFNSVFLFKIRGVGAYDTRCGSMLESYIRHFLIKDQTKLSVNGILEGYRDDHFQKAFIQLTPENEEVYYAAEARRWRDKFIWGRHSRLRKWVGISRIDVMVNARNMDDFYLHSTPFDSIRSLFVKNLIVFQSSSDKFPTLTHLNWTIDSISSDDFTNMASRFPKLKSLTLNLSTTVSAKFSLRSFESLEEFRINDCPKESGITFTAGRSFVPLRRLVLSNFKGQIFDIQKKNREICDLERLFIRKLVLNGENSDDVNAIILRAIKTECNHEIRDPISPDQCKSLCEAYISKRKEQIAHQREASRNDGCCCCSC